MLFAQDLPIRISDNKILLQVKVTPKASKNRIGKIFNNSLKIYVRTAAEDGQANKAVLELLSHNLKISKSNFSIVHGLTVQNKIISINGDIDLITKRLQIIIAD
jgi:uncharacterized protein